MSRELLLLRHGKSDWETGREDLHRPLVERGREAARRIGVWLPQHDMVPDLVISSPAARALETARKCCKTMGLRPQDIQQEREVYLAEVDDLLEVVTACPAKAKRVMLVGHNPGLEEFLLYLTADRIEIPADGKLLPTGTLARLRMPHDWSNLPRGCAELLNLVRPGELPDSFPFPDDQGEERRERPAYYYTQSAVVPYRIQDGQLRILVIGSRAGDHWVVPKGIQEPGLTARESAAVEAREEAGVEGEVMPEPLGNYRYPKWGAECSVTLYGMRVERMAEDAEWLERHRERKWLPVAEAIRLLKQKELGPLIEKLAKQLGA